MSAVLCPTRVEFVSASLRRLQDEFRGRGLGLVLPPATTLTAYPKRNTVCITQECQVATRTVRLDEEAESALREIQRVTQAPISEVLKTGLRVLRDQVRREGGRTAIDIFESIEPAPGGDAIGPSTDVRAGVARALKRKHRR